MLAQSKLAQRLGRPVFGLWVAALLTGIGVATKVFADVPESQIAEVEHLLSFIETTHCRLIRNGREYSGDRAVRHVVRKYSYFRDRIESTEDFIALAASESTVTGQPYLFDCGGAAVPSRQILLDELRRFRASRD